MAGRISSATVGPQPAAVLGQSAPAAGTLTTLYTVPRLTGTKVTALIICNRGSSDTTFSVTIALNGAATTDAQYIYSNATCYAKDSLLLDLQGLTLGANDALRVSSLNGMLSFNLFGLATRYTKSDAD